MPPEVFIEVTGLATGGLTVGKVYHSPADPSLVGIKCFLTGAVPGENIRVQVTAHKRNYLEGELLEVLSTSPERVAPPCPYYQQCGGCDLQHLTYSSQLHWKREMIIGALKSGGLTGPIEELVQQIVPGPAFSYRRRVTMHVDEKGRVGFYERKSRQVVAPEHCMVATAPINHFLQSVGAWSKCLEGIPATLKIESSEDAVAVTLLFERSLSSRVREHLKKKLAHLVKSLRVVEKGKQTVLEGSALLPLPQEEGEFLASQGSFSQVNWEINQKLVSTVVEEILQQEVQRVCELYAGAGNFTLPLARKGRSIEAVELDSALVQAGQEAVKGMSKVRFTCSSVEKYLQGLPQGSQFDAILADPPRSGLGSLVHKLPKAHTLYLISCHLPSCVRDLKLLTENGWRVKKVVPFDMFSQTTYVEVLSCLERV